PAPPAPVKLSSFTLGGFVYGGASRGTTVFALDREKGLMSLDFTKKSAPTIFSRWMPLLDGRRLTAKDGVCYVAGGLSGMHVYDMQNVAAPLETSWYDTGGGYANQVLLDNGRIYLSTHLATREPLVIFDAKNPQEPTKLGAVPNDERVFNSAFRAICMGENALLVAGEQCEMTVKIDDPSNPVAWGRLNMPNPINVDRSGSFMVTTNNYELQLVDVSNPESPQLVSTLAKNSGGEAVRFLNSTTLITTGDPGVWIVDVSDPKNPKKVSELAIPGSIMEAHIDGTTAYLPNLGNGVEVVDLSDLANPKLIGSIPTIGLAYDCFIDGDLLYVADSFAGMTIYQRGTANPTPVAKTVQTSLSLALGEDEQQIYQPDQSTAILETKQIVVISAADSGAGTLREALEQLTQGTTITFDPAVFPAKKPVTISLNTELPSISQSEVTLDASNAGVILDGSNLTEGNGITVAASRCTVMGLQIFHFPRMGLETSADYCQIGGDRSIGDGPMGQGNLASGNKINGFHIGGWYNVVQGNFAGLDVAGKQSIPNFYGMFVSDWAFYTTVGGLKPGEANVLSGNQNINFDSWGDHTRVIGNIFGLDASGQTAVRKETFSNITLESGVMDNVIGGTTPEERNILSGANVGIVFSDPNSYSCSVIGNYIGMDITGTKAIGNHDGVLLWTSGNHRVGGTRPGEANLISGNQNGVQLNGYGVTDNLVLGNIIGYDADGKPMPNECAISINMGQKHAVIGGYTSAEGNRIYGGSISMRVSESGAQGHFFAGNVFENAKGLNLFLENGANHNFVQANTFGKTSSNSIRVDYGEGNLLRGNVFTGGKPQDAILLLEGGNSAISAPEAKGTPDGVVGKTVPFGCVEVYRLDAAAITPLGFAVADKDGVFSYSNAALTSGTKAVLLVSDAMGNTSVFSETILIPNN
ncbi:MAG: hypothetical protein VB091_00670, partial [Christensenella sp.]|nr:hypothetical protein [Christensenella sp.]